MHFVFKAALQKRMMSICIIKLSNNIVYIYSWVNLKISQEHVHILRILKESTIAHILTYPNLSLEMYCVQTG